MTNFFKILILIISFNLITSISYADANQDCAAYDREKLHEKIAIYKAKKRCLKGLPPKEKTSIGAKIKKLNPLKLLKKQ
tara:strand:- start:45 stop:281 length:237 start_codon:yes stop_codon:yes gene_type:complete